jgi:hypothetical protein
MLSIYLHKFKFLPSNIDPSVYAQLNRLVHALSQSGQLEQLWQQLYLCRALKFNRDIYAYDNFALLSVLAKRYPSNSLTVQIVPVKTAAALNKQILVNLLVSSLCQIKTVNAPVFEREMCQKNGAERLFSTSEWAQILDVHRSTLYPKSRTPASAANSVIDIASVLKGIPLPTLGGKS